MARALSRTGSQFKDLTDAAAKHISTQKEGTEAAEQLKIAFENLNIDLDLTRRDLATLASPALISFFQALQSSLDNSGGILHNFVTGLQAVGTGVTMVVGFFQQLGDTIDRAFSLGPGTGMKVLLIALTVIVGLFASAWIAIPLLIVMVVTAMGGLSEITTKVKDYVVDLWEKFKDTTVYKFVEGLIEKVKELFDWLKKLPKWLGGGGADKGQQSVEHGGNAGEGGTAGDLGGGTTAMASGGQVDGPGTATSDSIMARLSRGEFVVRAAAVQAYGAGLFHALNNMQLPGFASGGLVPSPVRMAGGGSIPATSTLNLSIDGQSFAGLKGPKTVIDELASFSIARQSSAAGTNPSWMK